MEPFATELELVELLMRIYADEEPTTVADTVYCYGQEPGNTLSVVEKAAELLRQGKVRTIAIPTYGNLVKYSWFYDFIRTMLLEHGVPVAALVPIQHPAEFSIAHTHTEAIGLTRYAKEVGWRKIYTTALPSHLLRAFTETITAVLKDYPKLQAYSAVGAVLSWTEDTVHSQGTISGKRFEVIGSELKKILAYHLKGDLVSAREVLAYFNRRGLKTWQEEKASPPSTENDPRRRRLTMGEDGAVTSLD